MEGSSRQRRLVFALSSALLATSGACNSANGPGSSTDLDAHGGDAGSDLATPSDLAPAGTLSLLAGALGGPGSVDGTGAAARFDYAGSIAGDGAGNLYVADRNNCTIRKVAVTTRTVTTLAGTARMVGSADGRGTAALFDSPEGIASDGAGNLYVADTANNTIRRIVLATGEVTTLAGTPGMPGAADGTGAAARFHWPQGIVSDDAGNIYVADTWNSTIRRIVVATGAVTTLAGTAGIGGSDDGAGAAASFDGPQGIASDGAGNLYVADTGNHTIRKIVVATGATTTPAGTARTQGSADGMGAAASFWFPEGVASDGAGNLYIADTYNRTIRKIVVATGAVSTLAGTVGVFGSADGIGAAALLDFPGSIASDRAGNLYVADSDTIRQIVVATGAVSTLAGMAGMQGSADGAGAAARFDEPAGIASDGAGNLYVVDVHNNTIREVVVATSAVTTLAGTAGMQGSADGRGAAARFYDPSAIASDGAGNLYVADTGNHTIRKIVIATGEVTTPAGTPGMQGSADGMGAAARFHYPDGITSDGAGNLYVADAGNNTIRKVVLATSAVTTLAGTAGMQGSADGRGAAARFYDPAAIASDGTGNLYVTDNGNFTIRKIEIAMGDVTTLAGTPGRLGSADAAGAAAGFSARLGGIAVDNGGNLYVADGGNGSIRKIVIATAAVTTVVGVAGRNIVEPGPLPASLNWPADVAVFGKDLAITDLAENAVLIAHFF